MREKQIPVDSVEVKDNVQAFAWEPIGTKFAIIHGESQSMTVSSDKFDPFFVKTPKIYEYDENSTGDCLPSITWSIP